MAKAVFDTSTLTELKKEPALLGLLPEEVKVLALTEDALLEFYGLLGKHSEDLLKDDDKLSKQIQKIERHYRPFLVSNNFALIPSLHFLVKSEFIGDLPSTGCRIPSFRGVNIEELKKVVRDKLELKQHFANGSAKTISSKHKALLDERLNTIISDLENCLLDMTISILIPEQNGNIPPEIGDHKLFKSPINYAEARQTATNLIRASRGQYGIISISSSEVTMFNTGNIDGIKGSYNGFPEFADKFPRLLMLLIFVCIHFHEISFQKSKNKSLAAILEPNSAIDIAIILNFVCKNDYFITSDKGQVEYMKLLFKNKIKIEKKERDKRPPIHIVSLL